MITHIITLETIDGATLSMDQSSIGNGVTLQEEAAHAVIEEAINLAKQFFIEMSGKQYTGVSSSKRITKDVLKAMYEAHKRKFHEHISTNTERPARRKRKGKTSR